MQVAEGLAAAIAGGLGITKAAAAERVRALVQQVRDTTGLPEAEAVDVLAAAGPAWLLPAAARDAAEAIRTLRGLAAIAAEQAAQPPAAHAATDAEAD